MSNNCPMINHKLKVRKFEVKKSNLQIRTRMHKARKNCPVSIYFKDIHDNIVSIYGDENYTDSDFRCLDTIEMKNRLIIDKNNVTYDIEILK